MFNFGLDPGERRNIAAEEEKLARQVERELNEWLATEIEGPLSRGEVIAK